MHLTLTENIAWGLRLHGLAITGGNGGQWAASARSAGFTVNDLKVGSLLVETDGGLRSRSCSSCNESEGRIE